MQKTTFTDIPFQFILQQQTFQHIIKVDHQLTYLLRTKILCFVCF